MIYQVKFNENIVKINLILRFQQPDDLFSHLKSAARHVSFYPNTRQ